MSCNQLVYVQDLKNFLRRGGEGGGGERKSLNKESSAIMLSRFLNM